MKRRDLLAQIATAARRSGVEWRLVRQGGEHELWQCGPIRLAVPRHREIGETTSRRIMTALEPALGPDWWRR